MIIQTGIRISRDLRGDRSMLSLLSRPQMGELALFARDTAVARIRRGLDVRDAQMPPLKPGYARAKSKRGLSSMRDFWGTGRQGGHMLDHFIVTSVSDGEATIGFSGAEARLKAFVNATRAEGIGLSPDDIRKIADRAHQLIRGGISAVDLIRYLTRQAA